jgi:peptide/nickel transport system ATP-binding protein
LLRRGGPAVHAAAVTAPLLELRNLSVSFRTGTPRDPVYLRAVDDVSLRVPVRSSVGVVGESGSGKSVTALTILRLIPEPPGRIDSGQILYYGSLDQRGDPSSDPRAERLAASTPAEATPAPTDLRALPPEALRRLRGNRVAMVFQEPMTTLNPVFPVGDQVGEVLRAHAPPGERISQTASFRRAVELLDQVGIPDASRRAHDFPHQLSGGQRQRVVIAMALACGPDLLIADEPTTALDVTTQAQILDLLLRLKGELGMSLLLISHDLGVVAEVCESVAVMYAGQIVEQAPARALFRAPRHHYTAGLMMALPRLNVRRSRLREIAGRVPRLSEMPAGCRFAARCERAEARCRSEAPLLRPLDPALVAGTPDAEVPGAHLVRCHFPLDGVPRRLPVTR